MNRILLSVLLMVVSRFSFAHDAHTTDTVFSNLIHLLTAPDHVFFMLVSLVTAGTVLLKRRKKTCGMDSDEMPMSK